MTVREFEKHVRQTEPGRRRKALAWQTAIGLRDVDGLKVSSYLTENARKHIKGEMTVDDVRRHLKTYHESKSSNGIAASHAGGFVRAAAGLPSPNP